MRPFLFLFLFFLSSVSDGRFVICSTNIKIKMIIFSRKWNHGLHIKFASSDLAQRSCHQEWTRSPGSRMWKVGFLHIPFSLPLTSSFPGSKMMVLMAASLEHVWNICSSKCSCWYRKWQVKLRQEYSWNYLFLQMVFPTPWPTWCSGGWKLSLFWGSSVSPRDLILCQFNMVMKKA